MRPRSALGGTMIRSRMKKLAIVAGAGAVATASILALNPFSASAADAAATTTTVTASAHATAGHSVKFTATVSPRATGIVTFTITGSDSSPVPCLGGNAPALKPTGAAICKVAPGVLKASASPYTVTASYAGNANFASSTGTMSESIGLATPTVKVTVDQTPATHQASTFTATVSGSTAGAPTGTVTFIVTAQKPSHAKTLVCQGGKVQALSATGTPPQMTATCLLPATWLKLKKANKGDPNPSNTWTVVANYNGDKSYQAEDGIKSGTATQ
jgi:hypothetical protein